MENEFFLTTAMEFSGLARPRRCLLLRRSKSLAGNEILVVQIAPVLSGQPLGFGGREFDKIIVSARYHDDALAKIDRDGIAVNVFALVNEDALDRRAITPEDLCPVSPGALYVSEHVANDVFQRSQN